MKIELKEKKHKGKKVYSVVDEEQRYALWCLTNGQDTLTERQYNALITLGFVIVEKFVHK